MVTLNNVAHVPGLGLHFLFLDAEESNRLLLLTLSGSTWTRPDGCFFPSNDVGIQLPATRQVHTHRELSGPAPVPWRVVGLPPVAAATIAPAEMPVDIISRPWILTICMYDMLTPIPEFCVRLLRRQLVYRLTGEFRACGGCSICV